jgi:hypothetical protein
MVFWCSGILGWRPWKRGSYPGQWRFFANNPEYQFGCRWYSGLVLAKTRFWARAARERAKDKPALAFMVYHLPSATYALGFCFASYEGWTQDRKS